MKIIIDMNLSPQWVHVFKSENYEAIHWSAIGDPRAADSEILLWAKKNNCIIFTHDLDFGAILAASNAEGPSVLQIRTADVSIHALKQTVLFLLSNYRGQLEEGALIIVDKNKSRIRMLPLNRSL